MSSCEATSDSTKPASPMMKEDTRNESFDVCCHRQQTTPFQNACLLPAAVGLVDQQGRVSVAVS